MQTRKLAVWALNAILLVGVMPATTVPLTGCSVSAAQIATDGQAVANALLSVAKIEATVDPTLAANLTTAANGLLSVTANWQTGSAVAVLNDAAAACEVALAAIPQTAAIAPLIPIAVAALDVLLSAVGSNSNAVVTLKASAPNPYAGYKIHHRVFRSIEGDFKSAWNGVVAQHPELASAKIK